MLFESTGLPDHATCAPAWPHLAITGEPAGANALLSGTMAVAAETGLAIGVALTLVGLLLQVRLGRQRMSAEEGMKDGRLTEAQAVLKIRLWAIAAPTLSLLGAMMLVAGLAGYLH